MNAVDTYFPYIAPKLQIMNETTAQNTLYGHIDLSDVSWMERKWASYYIWAANPLIGTGILSFVWHEVSDNGSVRKRLREVKLSTTCGWSSCRVYHPGVEAEILASGQ